MNSVSRLGTIALALGEDRTRAELVPFLSENIDDEDEVLLAEAEQLGQFVPYVGGSNHAYLLLPLLESLSKVEETVVRDKAVQSLCKVGAQLPDNIINDAFTPLAKVRIAASLPAFMDVNMPFMDVNMPSHTCSMVRARPVYNFAPSWLDIAQRLATGEWFTSRVSATGLFATAYPRCAVGLKAELRQLYSQLCRDETPMVRRAAAHKLGAFAKSVEREYVSRELMPLFTDLMQDGEVARKGGTS